MAVTSTFGLLILQNLTLQNVVANADATKLSGGGFVVAGALIGQTDATIFDANGDVVGSPSSFSGWSSSVSQLSNGNIVVAVTNDRDIRYTIFNGTGTSVVAPTGIGENAFLGVINPDVAGGLAGGRFVIAYEDRDVNDIRLDIRNNSGTFVTNIAVDSSAANDRAPSVAALNDGGFAVAWHRTVGSETELWYAVYEGDGSVRHAPALLDTFGSINRNPSIVALNSGGFAIAYEDNGWGGGTDIEISLARFSAIGTGLGITNISQNVNDDTLPSATVLSNGIIAVGSTGDFSSTNVAQLVFADPNTGAKLGPGFNLSMADHDTTQSTVAGRAMGQLAMFYTDTTSGQAPGEILQLVRGTNGDAAANVIVGDELVDQINAKAGADTVHGGANDDVLTGGLGKDNLYGDAGVDTFRFETVPDSGVGGAARDVIHDWAASEMLDFESIDANSGIAGNQNFTFLGLGSADHIVGQGQIKYYQFGGNTYVVGNITPDSTADFQIEILGLHNLTTGNFVGLSNAVLTGTGGNDTLTGTGGNDTLKGEAGTDALIGLLGKDSLFGGLGADTFVFTKSADTAVGANRDVIKDWGSSDKIDVAVIDANTGTGGNQDFTFIGLGSADHTVGQGQIKYYQFGGNTYVVGNTTADTDADFQVEITGLHALAASNFLGVV